LSKHNVVTPPADEIDGGAMYAETIVIDEGGVDLKIDGETIISASFDGVDHFQLAYEVLPESYTFSNPEDREGWDTLVEEASKHTGVPSDLTDEDIELAARAFLTALARRKGYEKK
jgi:hypothetical protein